MSILDLFLGGDMRMVRGVGEAVQRVLAEPSLLMELLVGMQSTNPMVCMRSADAVEKITAAHPEWLQPHKLLILNVISRSQQQEVRWHIAQLIPRLSLTARERRQARDIFMRYLDDKSAIVRTSSMQALADLALHDAGLKGDIVPVIARLTATGTPAMRARGKRLLKALNA